MASKMQTCLLFFISTSARFMTQAAGDASTNYPDPSSSSFQSATSSYFGHSDWSIQSTSVPGNSMLIGLPDSASLTIGHIHPTASTQSAVEVLHEIDKVDLSATNVMHGVVSGISDFENSVPFFFTTDIFAPFTSMFISGYSVHSSIPVPSSTYSNKLYDDSNHQSDSSNMDAFNIKWDDHSEFVKQDYSHDVTYSSLNNVDASVSIPGASSGQTQSLFWMSEISYFSSASNYELTTSSLSMHGIPVSSSKGGHNTKMLLSSSPLDMPSAINVPSSLPINYENKQTLTSSVLSLSSSYENSISLTDVAISTNSLDISYPPTLRPSMTMSYSVSATSSELQDSNMSTSSGILNLSERKTTLATKSSVQIVSTPLSPTGERLKESSYIHFAISANDTFISLTEMTDIAVKTSIFPSHVQTNAISVETISQTQELEVLSKRTFALEGSKELSGMIQSSLLSSNSPPGGASDPSFDDVSMTMANSTQSMAWISAELTSTVASGADENVPHLQHPIGMQLVAMGTLWEYSIPPDMFTDAHDGDTRNLTLSLSTINIGHLPSWIMFKKQVIYALPLPVDAVKNPVQLTLSAMNSIGFSSYANFQIYLNSSSVHYLTHLITITFDSVYDVFMKQRANAMVLIRKLESYFGEYGAKTIRIINISEGSLVLSWTNNSISLSMCDKNAIKSMYERLMNPDGNTTYAFRAYMRPEYKVLRVNFEYKGICLNETIDGTTDATKSERDIWIEIFVPTFIIILLGILVCLIVFIKRRRRRHVGEDVLLRVEKATFMREREPIIFPEEIEITDSAVRPKKPLVLSSEALEPHETSVESGHSDPPSYTTDDPNTHRSGTSFPPMYPGSERPSPPPYRLPPLYIAPMGMQELYS